MQRIEIDGVPVVWRQGPEPLSAGLVFRVGRRDETFATGGVTHLVEHLVMGSLPRSHLDRNASVDSGLTEFTATGRPEQVAQFLLDVCRALADLPVDRLATEARVLAAEETRAGGDLHGELLVARYGASGLGLSGMRDPAVAGLSAEQVRAHAAAYFVRSNAALWLTGPPPEGLRLPLADGTPPARRPQARLPLALPAQRRYPGPDVALSFEAPAGDALLSGLRIVLDRAEDALRHSGGHSYDVDFVTGLVDRDTAHVAFFADAPEAEVPAVVEGLWRGLGAFAERGPTAAELTHDVEGAREHLRDPRGVADEVAHAASGVLNGEPYEPLEQRLIAPLEQRLAALAALTCEQVRDAVAAGLASRLVLVPEDAPRVLPDVVELPELGHRPVEGRRRRRRWRGEAPPGSGLVQGPAGVSVLLPGGQCLTVRYAECVAVGAAPEPDHAHLDLVAPDGATLPLCERDWRGGADAVAEAEAALRGVERHPLADGGHPEDD